MTVDRYVKAWMIFPALKKPLHGDNIVVTGLGFILFFAVWSKKWPQRSVSKEPSLHGNAELKGQGLRALPKHLG